MPVQAPYIDLAQILLYLFWVFFAGLIYYLLRENKREGYPLESDRSDRSPRVVVQGFPAIPAPKMYRLLHGGTVMAPRPSTDTREFALRPTARHPGAAFEPTGNALRDGVGPGSWALRADTPDLTTDGRAKIVPLRADPKYGIVSRDPDPRGMKVLGADGRVGGVVRDVWVDRAEDLARYFEVEVGSGTTARRALLPVNFTRIKDGRVLVKAILGKQFDDAPGTSVADQVTLREEDRICAYYGGGTLYAEPRRQEPLL
jgi:photosynthetic reaction center H subunit